MDKDIPAKDKPDISLTVKEDSHEYNLNRDRR